MKYFFWRGSTLWCRYPLPGKPWDWSTKLKTTGSPSDRRRCERDGETMLAALRTEVLTGRLFDKPTTVQAPSEYNPKFWRLVGRYWHYHLRFTKSGANERYHLGHCLRAFGAMYAKDLTREKIELWRQEMIAGGSSVNSANNRFAYLQSVFTWAAKESQATRRVLANPTTGLEKLPGGKVRTFLLTPEKFERNYVLLRDGLRWPGVKPDKHCGVWSIPPEPRFSLFYLALWETGRRPNEVSQYTWEMVHLQTIDGRKVRYFEVPPEITKTDEAGRAIISDRLWREINQQAWRAGFVFLNAEGSRWKHWDRHKRKLERVFGADCGWIRDCRRGFVTRMCEGEGHDPLHVRMQTGHKTTSIFDRYRIGNIRNQSALFGDASHTDWTQKVQNA